MDKVGPAATVTDALVVLGRINAYKPISGGNNDILNVTAATAAIERDVGVPLGLNPEEAAQAIVTVANNVISGSIRRISIDRGHDPRDFALFSFGGGGGLFVSQLIAELEISHGLVPLHPGIASAWGCVVADIRRDFVRMINCPLNNIDVAKLQAVVDEHATIGRQFIDETGVPVTNTEVIVEADMGFEGQTHVIRTGLPEQLTSIDQIEMRFRSSYSRHYGHDDTEFFELSDLLESLPVRLLNLRTSVIGMRPNVVKKSNLNRDCDSKKAFIGTRKVYVEGAFRDCPTYDRATMSWDATLEGPAVIEQFDTTVWIEPGTTLRVAEGGSLVLMTKRGGD